MSDWKQIYAERTKTAEEAIQLIKNGDRVAVGHAAGVPHFLLQTLSNHYKDYKNVELLHMLTFGDAPYVEAHMQGHLRLNSVFVAANTRTAIAENRADFTPCFFHELPSLLQKGKPLEPQVAMVQLSLPNADGFCSFGVSTDYTKPSTDVAPIVIAQINDQMPFIGGGDNLIHVSKLTAIVEHSAPIFTLPQPNIGEVDKAIGEYCAELIKDGDTLQLGIGSIPDAVLLFLTEKKDLGIHTEMFSDGVVELVEKGIITGAKKTLHPGKLVATFLMGTQRLYDFVNNNPNVEMYPVNYVNDPRVILQNENIIAINSCIEVDLMGQVVSETIGLKQFSGTGGQVDYVRGASMAKGGISIMAMPSTAAKGKASRIVPFIAQGASVTTSRTDVDYVITEYGIAHLKGATLRQRAERLIKIAHPDFKPMLEVEFNNRFNQIK